MSMKLLYKAIQSHPNLFMARRSKAGATKRNHLQRQSDFEVSDSVATLGLPKIYTFWVTINMDANVRAAYYRCQRQTFDQVGPLYIVWSSGQVVDDFVHCQGWMSKNCTPSRWNTWRRDLGNGVVLASRRHQRTNDYPHHGHAWDIRPSLDVLLADLDLGLEYKHMASFVGISKHFTYFTIPPTCSEIMFSKRNANHINHAKSDVLGESHSHPFYPFLYFHPHRCWILLAVPAAVLALRPQKPGQLYWLDSKKIGVPSFLFEVRWFQDVRKIQEMNFSDGLSWFMSAVYRRLRHTKISL